MQISATIGSTLLPVSVVIPCFRCADTIGRAIESVQTQTARPREIILVDDASNDATPNLLERLAANYDGPGRMVVICLEKNSGAAIARNVGWSAATEQFVAFLDSDDSWHPRKLEIQYRLMDQIPEIAVSGHLHVVSSQTMRPSPIPQDPSFVAVNFRDLLWKNCFVSSSVMLKRNLVQRFPEGQRHMEDHRLWLDIAGAGHRLARIELPLAAHHKADFGAGGLSADLIEMERAELGNYRILKRRGAISRPIFITCIVWSLAKFIRRLLIVLLHRLA